MRCAAGGFYIQFNSHLRLPFRGGGTALAVTEGFWLNFHKKYDDTISFKTAGSSDDLLYIYIYAKSADHKMTKLYTNPKTF